MATVSIPAFHVSDISKVTGDGKVFIASRGDALHSGIFTIKVDVHFDPSTDAFPTGNITIVTDLSDSQNGTYKATSVDLINSYGKHNPTVFMTGRLKEDVTADGCRYWLMIANNKNAGGGGTPDIVGFAIHDKNGQRVSYGTGPLQSGDFIVSPK